MKHMQHGQSIIEFALIIPLLAMIGLAALDVGRALYAYSDLQNGVRDGARYGVAFSQSGYPSATDIRDKVRASAGGPTVNASQIDVQSCYFDPSTTPPACTTSNYTNDPSIRNGTNMLKVVATYNFVAITPFIPSFRLYAEAYLTFQKS